jgi:hypothetical protein
MLQQTYHRPALSALAVFCSGALVWHDREATNGATISWQISGLEGLELAQQQLQSGNTAPDWQQQQQAQGQRDADMLRGLDLLNSMTAPTDDP